MAETPTPRTDAAIAERQREIWQGEKPAGSIRTVNADRMSEVETDLQHLARFAGEALDEYLMAGHKEARRLASIKAKAALSEITRIQNQTT